MVKKVITDKMKEEAKKFLKGSEKIKPSEKTKKRMRAGKIKMKSDNPIIQKKIDDLYDKPTKLKVVKPKKMNGGGLATKGLGKAFLNSKR